MSRSTKKFNYLPVFGLMTVALIAVVFALAPFVNKLANPAPERATITYSKEESQQILSDQSPEVNPPTPEGVFQGEIYNPGNIYNK